LKREITNLIINSDYDSTSVKSFDSTKLLEFFEQPSRKTQFAEAISMIKDYQEVEYHKSVADMQRASYNKDCKDFKKLSHKVLIEFDFKEKIIVGIGPREVINILSI